jgi:hypothetical protein
MTHATILYFVINATVCVSQIIADFSYDVKGSIPTELGQLTGLTMLILGKNK